MTKNKKIQLHQKSLKQHQSPAAASFWLKFQGYFIKFYM